MPAGLRRMRDPTRPGHERGLQRRRLGLLVQGFDAASEAAEGAGKAEAADDHGAIAAGLPGRAEPARRAAVSRWYFVYFCPRREMGYKAGGWRYPRPAVSRRGKRNGASACRKPQKSTTPVAGAETRASTHGAP